MRFPRSFGVLLLLSAAACGTPGDPPDPSSDSGAPVSVGTTIAGHLGTILVGANGMSLYTRAGDTATTSTCAGACVTAWPPLTLSKGQQAVGGPGVGGTFGVLARTDGDFQATYDDHPLYYSQGDTSAGDVTGDGVDGFSVARP